MIEKLTIEVPKPQFYREPGFRAGVHDFPPTGVLDIQVLQKLQSGRNELRLVASRRFCSGAEVGT